MLTNQVLDYKDSWVSPRLVIPRLDKKAVLSQR